MVQELPCFQQLAKVEQAKETQKSEADPVTVFRLQSNSYGEFQKPASRKPFTPAKQQAKEA